MTFNEAYKNMCLGHRVSHISFVDGEYIYIDKDCVMRDESNYDLEDWYEFNKDNDNFQYGWSIYSYED